MSETAETVYAALAGQSETAKFSRLRDAVMSPTHVAVENDLWRVDEPGKCPRVLRILHSDSLAEYNPRSIVEGATTAGAAGAGPEILLADAETGTLLMPYLVDGWRTATMFDLKDQAVREGVIAATKRLHGGPSLSRLFDPFERVRTLYDRAKQVAAPLSADVEWLMDGADQVSTAVSAIPADMKPCRNDGCASNIMINVDGSVVLLDYDLAGMNDPAFDLGVLLAEAEVFDAEAIEWVRAWHGTEDFVLLSRARLYGAVDDLGWAISAAINAHVSDRISIEFRKYSEWRFMRCRSVIADRSFEKKVRQVAGGQ
jgi:thiamine kinase-like enzyme